MEYSFRTTAKADQVKIVLSPLSMIITEGEEQTEIPYLFVIAVRIIKFKNHYGAVLSFESGPSLTIVNYTFNERGNRLEQSRSYNTFLRVLHMHLHQNSKAEFVCGKTNENLLFFFLAGLVMSFAAAFGGSYFSIDVFYVRALSVLVLAFFVLMCWRHFIKPIQKNYPPDNIPMAYLPEN
jgi:hypothetical protein